ncbi:hypothetical protein H0H87_004052 [Tephrocybe sp. NHM501043]|nr:hypothetical protein H0H87_004052 [Tephrocybe sp. NHM501043]
MFSNLFKPASVYYLPPWELNLSLPLVLVGLALLLVIINSSSPGPDDEIDKRQGGVFRVPFLDHWEVVITGKKYINEIAQARDDDLSVNDPVAEVLQTEFTMGASIKHDRYHVGVIGSTMTRSLVSRFGDIYDEISSACEDAIQDQGKSDSEGWVSVPAFDAVINIVARTSTRLFVGLPLCRNADYLRLAKTWAVEVFLGAFFINFMPWNLKPFFAATELKTALAYIALHYDLKLEDACNGVKPPNTWISIALVPDKRAQICFRRRKEEELEF